MNDYPKAAKRFAGDTKQHEMTVLHEYGLYRHIKLATPAYGGMYRFDLITWPNNLMIRGDGPNFAFSVHPTADLFDLFRRTALRGEINPGYWSEKVNAGRGDIETYSEELLREQIEDSVKQWVADEKESAPWRDDFEQKLREAVNEHFFDELSEYTIEYESEAPRALDDFSFDSHYQATCVCGAWERFECRHDAKGWANGHLSATGCTRSEGGDPVSVEHHDGCRFADWWEWRLRDYSWEFLWACHAIAWGIDRYDKVRSYGLGQLATAKQAAA